MQYTKLGFNRLSKGFSLHQAQCILIGNHSVITNFSYCQRWQISQRKYANLLIDKLGLFL